MALANPIGGFNMPVVEGQPAPSFTLTATNGESVSVSDYLGKNVVVYFYPKDDTPGCTKESCEIRDLQDEFQSTGTEVIGISPDDRESHENFVNKYGLPFTLLCDEGRSVMAQYGAYGEKMMYGRKTIGVIRSTVLIGKDGNVIRHWKKVPKTAVHPAKVLEVVQKIE